MPCGKKRSYVLKQARSFLLQVWFSTYDRLLPPGINRLRSYKLDLNASLESLKYVTVV